MSLEEIASGWGGGGRGTGRDPERMLEPTHVPRHIFLDFNCTYVSLPGTEESAGLLNHVIQVVRVPLVRDTITRPLPIS